MLPLDTEVLIVGAGPTGLALANALTQAGIDHAVIDRLPAGENTSRAAVIHAHTLDALDGIGVAASLAERGLKLSRFSFRDRDRALLQLGFGGIDSPHPYLLMLPQDVTEAVLAERLAARGGMIRRGWTAMAVAPSGAGARATLSGPEGVREIGARFVVGADGMHSAVRAAAGIPFAGAASAESFILADVRMRWPLGQSEVSLFFSPAGLLVVAPLPGGAFRIVATLDPAPERPGTADIQALLDERGPAGGGAAVREVLWGSRFRIHHRLAGAYRKGPLFLVGDAAHVHSPAGGQGMNCGLVDALVLGRLLGDVVHGRRPAAALDDYERLRRPAAAAVLRLAGRLTRLATMRHPAARGLRNLALSSAGLWAPARNRLVGNLSGLARRHLAVLPQAAPG